MKSAVRVVATTFGIVVALAGLEHGTGEILQGSVPPPALVFKIVAQVRIPPDPVRGTSHEYHSQPTHRRAYHGVVLACTDCLDSDRDEDCIRRSRLDRAFTASTSCRRRLGPPLMLFTVGLAATRMHRPLDWWRKRSRESSPPLFAKQWRALLIASVVGYLALLPGIPVAEQLFRPLNAGMVVAVIIFSFVSFFLAIIAALAADSYEWTEHLNLLERAL